MRCSLGPEGFTKLGSRVQIALVITLAASVLPAPHAVAKTISQVPFVVGSVVADKFTRGYTTTSPDIQRVLFGENGGGVTFSYFQSDGSERRVACFIDPLWNRIVYAAEVDSIKSIGSYGSGITQFIHPNSIDASPLGLIYVADTGNDRICMYRFILWNSLIYSPAALQFVASFSNSARFTKPSRVLWDDNGTPGDYSEDIVWILDSGSARIAAYHVLYNVQNNGTATVSPYVSLDTRAIGGAVQPIAFTKGRSFSTPSQSGSYCPTDLYVYDSDRDRFLIYSVPRSTGEVTPVQFTVSYRTVPNPVPGALFGALATDAWGNILALDVANSRIYKFDSNLNQLDAYGSAGSGPLGSEQIQDGVSISMLRRNLLGSASDYTNQATLSELWSDNTGVQSLRLGIVAKELTATPRSGQYPVDLSYFTTDHGRITAQILDSAGTPTRTLSNAVVQPSGSHSLVWDGKTDAGTPVAKCLSYSARIQAVSLYASPETSTVMLDFDYSPHIPYTLHLQSNPVGAYASDNSNRITLTGNYAVTCTTCTAAGIRTISAPLIQNIGVNRYRFGSWSDGKPISHGVELLSDTTITLNLVPDDPPSPVFASPYLRNSVGANPASIAVGDFNQDGRPDLAVTLKDGNAISILLGRGDGTYYPEVRLPADAGPASVIVGDFNEDGWQDLVVGNSLANTLSFYRGNGDGTFQARTNISAGIEPRVFAGNVNKDTHADLIVANAGSNTVSVYIGQGNGSFLPRADYAVGLHPMAARVAKLRVAASAAPDTFPVDLVVANANANTVSVLLGRGDGTFASPVGYATGTSPRDLALADVTRNSVVDVVVANYGSSTISVLGGNGDGTLSPKTDYAVGSGPTALLVEDLSRDGLLDVATTNSGSSTVSVLKGTTSGTFASRTDFPLPYLPQAIAAGDFNADPYRDLVVGPSTSIPPEMIQVLLGNGDGTFGVRREFPTDVFPSSLAFGDLNGDSRPDIATTGGSSENSTISVFLNNGAGGFAPRTDYPVAGLVSRDIHLTDVNGDGKLDAVYTSQTGPAAVFVRLGTGTGTFGAPTSYPTGQTPISMAIGDVNNDGIVDFVVADNDQGEVRMRLGTGGGLFGTETLVYACLGPSYVRLEDVNGDGRLDLLFTGGSPGAIYVLHGNGNGTFGSPQILSTFGGGLAFGDVDRDGIKDLVVGSAGSVQILKWYGDPFGYVLTAAIPVPWGAGDVALGDFSGDGWPDICFASGDGVSVLIGRGDGTFGAATSFGTGGGVPVGGMVGIEVMDVDGDGRLDVVGADGDRSVVSVLLNQVTITAVSPAVPPVISALNQNFPNPFNPRTKITFSLATSGRVRLLIFDVAGRLVAKPVDGVLSPGPHEVTWSGLDKDGRLLASGVYYYRLQAPGFVRSRKMVLLK